MKNLYFILFSILLISCTEPNWEKVKVDNSHVTIKFPGKPSYKSKISNAPFIGKMKFDTYRFIEKNTVFTMQISEPMDVDISKDSLYDSIHAIKRVATKNGRKIISESETITFGYDTYMITSKKRNGGIIHMKFIKIKNQQYSLLVDYKNGKDDYMQVEKFFNSFSI